MEPYLKNACEADKLDSRKLSAVKFNLSDKKIRDNKRNSLIAQCEQHRQPTTAMPKSARPKMSLNSP